jgi:hypothetical protein
VTRDPRYLRPAEVDVLIGDAAKAREKLGWKPTVAFHDLVEMMVDADQEAEKRAAAAAALEVPELPPRQVRRHPAGAVDDVSRQTRERAELAARAGDQVTDGAEAATEASR